MDPVLSFVEYLTSSEGKNDQDIKFCMACVSKEIDFRKFAHELNRKGSRKNFDQLNLDIDKFGEEKLYLVFERTKPY